VEAAKRVRYKLILMDIMMPDVDGLEATRQIRKNESLSGFHVPIAAVTAQALDGDKDRCIAVGMDDYISKPFSIDQLKDLISKWIASDASNQDQPTGASISESSLQNNAINSTESPVNLEQLKIHCPQGLDELVKVFIDSVADDIAELEKAVIARDTKETTFRAHSLKGSCATFCAGSMQALCVRIEAAAKDERWSEVEFSFETLKIASRHTQSFLQKANL